MNKPVTIDEILQQPFGLLPDMIAAQASAQPDAIAVIDEGRQTSYRDLNALMDRVVAGPSDEAFAKLPKGDLDKLIKNKKKLTEVRTYHVVSGAAVKKADIASTPSAKTVAGPELAITSGTDVKINDSATIVSFDIAATNGVIHVIDAVLMPPQPGKAPKAAPKEKAAAK